jgi:hypothetical protein
MKYYKLTTMVKCVSCGVENPDNAVYCMSCGKPITPVTTTPTAPGVVEKTVPGTAGPITVRVLKPPVGPTPTTAPTGITAPTPLTPPGRCFYHTNLAAIAVCAKCGRQLCSTCAYKYGDLYFCPEHYLLIPKRSRTWLIVAIILGIALAATAAIAILYVLGYI